MKSLHDENLIWTGLARPLRSSVVELAIAVVLLGVLVAPGLDAAAETVTPLAAVPVSASTGEKPQSKVWFHAGTWWAVLPSTSVSPAGSWLWRLEPNNSWTNVLQLSDDTTAKADTKPLGDVTHILLHNDNPGQAQLVSVEYCASGNTYQLWSERPTATAVALPDSETATIDIDSTERMWLSTESGPSVDVYYSDPPYPSFAGPIILANNISEDDISVVTAFPNGTIGVLWSNENTQRFGFKFHQDGVDPNEWSANEVPASQSALNIGDGMADNHLNVAVASDGTLYAAVKTGYDVAGLPRVGLLVRHPDGVSGNGRWDDLFEVDEMGTRGIVLLNEAAGTIRVVYTSLEGFNNIVFKESSVSSMSFGPRQTLITGSVNNVTSTKQNWTDQLVVLAASKTSAKGVLITHAPEPPPPPAHDVGTAGVALRTQNHVAGVSVGPVTRAVAFKIKNFGAVPETDVPFKVEATCIDFSDGCGATVTYSAGCTGNAAALSSDGVLDPGEAVSIAGCTATYSGAPVGLSDWFAHLLVITHCGTDGNSPPCAEGTPPGDGDVDADLSNNTAVTSTKVLP